MIFYAMIVLFISIHVILDAISGWRTCFLRFQMSQSDVLTD